MKHIILLALAILFTSRSHAQVDIEQLKEAPGGGYIIFTDWGADYPLPGIQEYHRWADLHLVDTFMIVDDSICISLFMDSVAMNCVPLPSEGGCGLDTFYVDDGPAGDSLVLMECDGDSLKIALDGSGGVICLDTFYIEDDSLVLVECDGDTTFFPGAGSGVDLNGIFTPSNDGGTVISQFDVTLTDRMKWTVPVNGGHHIHGNTTSWGATLELTNTTTGSTWLSDGLIIAIDGSENSVFWNRENTHMKFYTNNIEYLTLLNSGKFGVGTNAPDGKLEVNLGTADAFRLNYNDANGAAAQYMDITMGSAGQATFNAVGSGSSFKFLDSTYVNSHFRLSGKFYDGTNSAGSNTYLLSSTGTGTLWVPAPSGGDDWGSDVVNTDNTLTGDGTVGDVLKVDTTVIATLNDLVGLNTNLFNTPLTLLDNLTHDGDGFDFFMDNFFNYRVGATNQIHFWTDGTTEMGILGAGLYFRSDAGAYYFTDQSGTTIALPDLDNTQTLAVTADPVTGQWFTTDLSGIDTDTDDQNLTVEGSGPSYQVAINDGTDVTIAPGTGISLSESPANTLVITNTVTDTDTDDQGLTVTGAGPNYTIDIDGGSDVIIAAGSGIILSESPANTLVITQATVPGWDLETYDDSDVITIDPSDILAFDGVDDMSVTQAAGVVYFEEGQHLENTSDATSHTVALTTSKGSLQLVEGANITLTTTGTADDGIVTIASTGGGGGTMDDWLLAGADTGGTETISDGETVTIDGAAGTSVTRSTNTILITEGDAAVTNEGALSVTAGSGTTSVIHSNTSGATDVTLTAGTGMTITENTGTGTITLASSVVDTDGQDITANGAGPTSYTIDVSGSATAVTLAEGSGINLTRSTNTITVASTVTDTDDQALTFDGGSGPVGLVIDNVPGTVDFIEGSGISLTSTATTMTIAATGGSSDHDWYEETTTTAPNNINDHMFTGTGDHGFGTTTPDKDVDITGATGAQLQLDNSDADDSGGVMGTIGFAYGNEELSQIVSSKRTNTTNNDAQTVIYMKDDGGTYDKGLEITYLNGWANDKPRVKTFGGIQNQNWINQATSVTLDEGHYGVRVTGSGVTIGLPLVTVTNTEGIGTELIIYNKSGGNIFIDPGGASDTLNGLSTNATLNNGEAKKFICTFIDGSNNADWISID